MVRSALEEVTVHHPGRCGQSEVRASKTFEADAYLYSMIPHLHVRGKDFTYTAVYPDGRSEKDVRWGDQTWEVMMIGWYTTVRYLDPAAKPNVASSSTGEAK
jgi:hypothetical protein